MALETIIEDAVHKRTLPLHLVPCIGCGKSDDDEELEGGWTRCSRCYADWHTSCANSVGWFDGACLECSLVAPYMGCSQVAPYTG